VEHSAVAVERPQFAGHGAEGEAHGDTADDIGGMVNAHMDPTDRYESTEAEQSDLGWLARALAEEDPGDHGRARMTARETGGERDAHLVWPWFLYNGSFPLEAGLDDSVDEHGLGGQCRSESPCGSLILFGSQPTKECQQHPDESEVAEFGQGIENPISWFGAPEAIEPSIDNGIEAIDGGMVDDRLVERRFSLGGSHGKGL